MASFLRIEWLDVDVEKRVLRAEPTVAKVERREDCKERIENAVHESNESNLT